MMFSMDFINIEDEKDVTCARLRCFQCGKSIDVPKKGDMLAFMGTSAEEAQTEGSPGYCGNCKKPFCSEHSTWYKEESEEFVYVAGCPLCQGFLSGFDLW